MPSNLRLPVQRLRKRVERLGATVNASEFEPELLAYTGRVLATCLEMTPARDEQLIINNQVKEYENRVNYIPSIHDTTADPRLIYGDDGERLFFHGRWYLPWWKLPNDAWAAYLELSAERERRLATSRTVFINARKQARFLYKKSWVQVARSIKVALSAAQAVIRSTTRRKPKQMPPKGYAQIRGGKDVLSVVIFNPFLEIESRYKPFSGKAILTTAKQLHAKRFKMDVENKTRRLMRAAMK